MNKNPTLASLLAIIIAFFILISIVLFDTEKQLDDCRFEVNDLQTRLYRLEELQDYIPAMEQLLPSLALAQLKAATEMIRQKKYKNYEAIEQPILNEKELRKLKK